MALFIPCRGELLCPSDWTIFEENMENPFFFFFEKIWKMYHRAVGQWQLPPPHPLKCNSPS